ncbi:FAD-dependent urate hydroxylase HpxO [Erwinia pyrifoliae]|uniref:FAD-dependent urate hydroxylase n=1 Tax=Erwinia pyrifoliae TaxID=79967 RepID=A0ABY5XCR5_ERWPY|nr:FAD-dependent urate hydroxylase HpxO [Erwinia pyrifoliae]MCT2387209.1 FAD-dependent urate hydroxylase HpxO [Erwinia pyrifoliae]MCU8587191.1 FAD-dependent urate hydroxylase HpxO [Erwinia pyrifoliae]UWS31052.1 FAD-dependent urate hydroxylase HpxO [Erwinia pyrifoliae]UWS35151.1 FAD-dependent urate hydroxylase HpxO [Erwinia pyrifoliae]UXK14038.1 FAD-dependent urate hydroxylase HpxO [Erwinia pyrifoliae]
MKAMIIGAGIGGMCTAIALRRCGIECDVFEAVKEIKPVGAAISIWPNGVKCLNYLGMKEALRAIGGTMDYMAYRDFRSADTLTQFSLAPLVQHSGERPYPVVRSELQAMLLDTFGRSRVQFGKRICRVAQNGDGVTAFFEDGSEAHGDLLIACDGTHSVVRKTVLGFSPDRRYAGYVNWNGLVEIDPSLAPVNQWTTFVGEGKRVSLMPVAGNRFYFFFDVPLPKGLAEDRSSIRADLTRYFAGWAAPVQRLIAQLDPDITNRVEIHDIEPFAPLVKGRIALLGDAAHSTTPDIGQGGCAAMEDAVVLAMALQSNSLGIEDALLRYQSQRAGRVKDLVLKARKRCDITHAKDAALTAEWYAGLKQESGERIIGGMCETIQGGPLP